jgi:DNA-binding HxlR family transcriptional regulator
MSAAYVINGRAYECPVQLAAQTLGGKWKMHIVWHLLQEPEIRFAELRRRILGGITEKMLISSLKELEADGLVARDAHPVVPPRVYYSLTSRGTSLAPIIRELAQFGKAYAAPPA